MIIRKKRLERRLRSKFEDGRREGLWEIVGLLKKKDKIYLEPITMIGDNQTLSDSVIFGNDRGDSAITVISSGTDWWII